MEITLLHLVIIQTLEIAPMSIIVTASLIICALIPLIATAFPETT